MASLAMLRTVNSSDSILKQTLDDARSVLTLEAKAIEALAESLGEDFQKAADQLSAVKGRVIISGIGKSGHIARKIAATLASTGQPAFFVHAAEASHGDLGMITKEDGLLVLSSSGETEELKPLLAYARRFAIPIIAITKNRESALGMCSDIPLILPDIVEACPMGLAPTTSTTMMLALGDALAVCLLKRRGFSARDYGLFHPGGNLGQQLTTVGDKMHVGRDLPLTTPDVPMADVITLMSDKGFGCVGILDDKGKLLGIITDGDLRRFSGKFDTFKGKYARDVMKENPYTVTTSVLMAEALRILQEKMITTLFITDPDKKPIGLIHIHDFLKSGVL